MAAVRRAAAGATAATGQCRFAAPGAAESAAAVWAAALVPGPAARASEYRATSPARPGPRPAAAPFRGRAVLAAAAGRAPVAARPLSRGQALPSFRSA